MSWPWQPLLPASADLLGTSAQTVVPDATALTLTLPSPTLVKGAISRVPDATALTFTIPSPTIAKTLTVVASPIALSFALPTPTRVIGALAVVASPTPLTFALPTPTIVQVSGQVVVADPISLSFTLPTPTRVIGALTLVADPTPLLFAVPSPGVVNAGAQQPQTGGGGGRARRRRRRRSEWRDPLYATADLQRAFTEDDELEPEEIVAEAVGYVGGALQPEIGALAATLPAMPEAVSRAIFEAEAWDWSEVIAAIKAAHKRERDREERGRILRYRAKVEALRRKILQMRDDDEAVDVLMEAGGL